MTSREKILQAIKAAQPEAMALPPAIGDPIVYDNPILQFSEIAKNGGSTVMEVTGWEAVRNHIVNIYIPALQEKWHITDAVKAVTTLKEVEPLAELINNADTDPHTFQHVDLAVLSANFGVAENSALWVPEQVVRVLPFICQHLVLIVNKDNIISNMHQAYERMGLGEDPFGAFIAGPSKTADIEQSLVLGAHGPRSLGVYLVEN